MLGYGLGVHAPGKELLFDGMPVAHHLLLAHGRAAMALRAHGAESIGCANNHAPIWPASEDPADVGDEQDLRPAVERGVPRADAAGPLPDRHRAAARARRAPRRHGHDPPAARLLRRQLLQPDARRRRRGGRDDALRDPRHPRLPDHRLRLARRARRAARVADHLPRPLPRRPAADRHHRVGLLLQHGPGRGRASSTTSRASTTSTPTSAPSPTPSTAAWTSAATTAGR